MYELVLGIRIFILLWVFTEFWYSSIHPKNPPQGMNLPVGSVYTHEERPQISRKA